MDPVTINIIITSLTLISVIANSFIKHLKKSKCCNGGLEIDMKNSHSDESIDKNKS